MNYFKKFPVTFYNGRPAINILAHAALSKMTKANKFVFYPYTMPEALRPDLLAERYYDTPELEWLVHFSNDTVDPYYSYVMNENDFYNYIVKKYGSWDLALRKIYFYRTNWLADNETITIDEFENLDTGLKKYYTVVFDDNLVTTAYRRVRTDITVNTNKIVQLGITYTNGTSFTKGEEVQVNGTNYAFCTASDTTYVIVQHVSGTFALGNTITGQESGTTATITSVTTLATPIGDGSNDTTDERNYWEPVTYLQYEEELNLRKKEIKLVDKRYSTVANEHLATLMRDT